MISTEQLCPIRVLSEATGVPTVTLRAWERRYRLLTPQRTPSGHRLYSHQDIALIKRVAQLIRDGHSVGDIARRLKDAPPENSGYDTTAAQCREAMLRGVADFSSAELEEVYARALTQYSLETVFSQVIEPVLDELGRRWLRDDHGIAEEHFFSAWLRNRLAALIKENSANEHGPRIVCACLPGNYHEIGLMIFALLAMRQGYRVVYLGNDMPLHPLPGVIKDAAARALVLVSSVIDQDAENLTRLDGFAALAGVPVMVGGPLAARQAEALQAMNIVPLGDKMAIALHILSRHITPRADTTGAADVDQDAFAAH